ncbi:hypothetical protein [uncultured Roseobacter sp.]|uniref:hypothetical protein n=1 Tax=uncultured Roseobacter sp. TaxID=114847 RepID=UPI002612D7BE|nr:hypothetical protein [uncultured Roseobacter sp.]
MILFITLALAVAVYWVRPVIFVQVASDFEWCHEHLKPRRGYGTISVVDIAGFTVLSAKREP